MTQKASNLALGLLAMSVALASCGPQPDTETAEVARASAPITVYLLAGQSNMVGSGTPKATLPVALQSPQPDVEFYHSLGPGPLQEDAWVPLQPGSTFDFGPEVTFGRSIADRFPKERIALIKYAAGNTNLAENWDPDTGPLYPAFRATAKAALKALTDRGDTYKIAGMVWMQGESDAHDGTMASKYQTNLTAFVARVRNDFAAPALPIVIGRIYPGTGTSSGNLYSANTVRKAQMTVADRDPHATWVDLDGLPQQDAGVEFNGPGTAQMGTRFAEAMQRLRQ